MSTPAKKTSTRKATKKANVPPATKVDQITKPAPIIAYKGFDKDLKCRGYRYEVGKEYTHDGRVSVCDKGFHACTSPLDVFGYYGPFESRFAEVELSGEISRKEGEDSKVAAGKIKIRAEIKLPDFINLAVRHIVDACKTVIDCGKVKSDDGNSARIGSSGNSARIGSSGNYARIGSSGDYAQIGSSGNSARIGSSGDYARIGSSGDYAQIEATGKDATIACSGSVEKFRAGEGGCICAPYNDGHRTRFAVGYVGENLKADTWYRVSDEGDFVEVSAA